MGRSVLAFQRVHRWRFPRWSVAYRERGGLTTVYFLSRWGCRRFAYRLGRDPMWMR